MGFWQFATGGGSGGGTGDVVGPASSTDNAVARWDLATGKLLQDSSVLVPDGLSGTVVVGSTGATDLGIIIANGTGGSTVAASAATLTAAGSLTIPNNQTISIAEDTALVPTLILSGLATVGIGKTPAGFGLVHSSTVYTDMRSNALVLRSTSGSADGGGLALSPSATEPGVLPFWSDLDTGIGRAGEDMLSIVAGGVEVARASEGVSGVSNGLTYLVPVEANTAGSGTPNAIAATESGTAFTNEGVTAKNYHTLPSAVAGYKFTFIVQDADGMRIVANTDDTIRVIDKVTAAAGYIESTTIGSTVTLVSVNAVEWYATSIKGTWTDGTFTYDDTSLTTP